jgi:hypothetical protein
MRLATLGGTGAFITTATMAVITKWGPLGYCLAGATWELGPGVIPSRWDHKTCQTCPGVRGMAQNFAELLSTIAPEKLVPILRTARQSAERNFMSSIRTRQRQSDYLVTVPSVWLEGDSPTPSTHVVKAWAPPVNIVLAILFGRRRDISQPDSIVNKLSGKALELEDPTSQGPRIEHRQGAPNDAPTGSLDVRYVGTESSVECEYPLEARGGAKHAQ